MKGYRICTNRTASFYAHVNMEAMRYKNNARVRIEKGPEGPNKRQREVVGVYIQRSTDGRQGKRQGGKYYLSTNKRYTSQYIAARDKEGRVKI